MTTSTPGHRAESCAVETVLGLIEAARNAGACECLIPAELYGSALVKIDEALARRGHCLEWVRQRGRLQHVVVSWDPQAALVGRTQPSETHPSGNPESASPFSKE